MASRDGRGSLLLETFAILSLYFGLAFRAPGYPDVLVWRLSAPIAQPSLSHQILQLDSELQTLAAGGIIDDREQIPRFILNSSK